jgi:transcriptional regulator with XRE-family HTH domain
MARRNLSQNDLAKQLGVSSGYMSQLLCGSRRPSPRLRRRMLESLSPLGFDDLFVLENDGNNDHRT